MPARARALQRRDGFTLVELLVVIGVIGIVAAVSIPAVLRSRMTANSASAAGSLKTIAAAQHGYHNDSPGHTYAPVLDDLRTGRKTGGLRYIDDGLASGVKSGYVFRMIAGGEVGGVYYSWSAEAHPFVYLRTGVRSFYIDETGMLLGGDIGGAPGSRTMGPE
jgi:prepilin-type N-terminal cleavage/methylation domain-containing protein